MNRDCYLCQQPIIEELTWQELFSFKCMDKPVVCPICQAGFIKYQCFDQPCAGCGRALDANSHTPFNRIYKWKQEIFCWDCYRWLRERTVSRSLLNHQAIYVYNDFFRSFIYRYKYLGDYRLAKVPARDLRSLYASYQDYCWLVLPSSPQSLQKRLFHPTASILTQAGIPFLSPYTYIGDGVRQASKSRDERLNLSEPFKIDQLEFLQATKQNKFMVFDDVYTTGATMIQAKRELIRVLKLAGIINWQVSSLSLGRDPLKEMSVTTDSGYTE